MTGTSVTIITRNEIMRSIIDRINKISDSESSVLLLGETGAGKEIFAEYIHRSSNRAANPFVKIGLAALPAELMASELFGYEKGAFTSATAPKKGLFEMADSGSIFLDDIDDVPMDIQVKLLRVLESREIMRIGGTSPIPVNIRLITASKVPLEDLVEKGEFREDLFYRINVVPLKIPALRKRREDIPLLVEYFIKHYVPDRELPVSQLAMKALKNYCWPGNVRELKNMIHRVTLFAEDEVSLADLPEEIGGTKPVDKIARACKMCFNTGTMPFSKVVSCVEINLINAALEQADGKKSEAARLLNMSLSTFRDKLKKHNLSA